MAMSGRQTVRLRSRSLDRGSKSGKRVAQVLVRDIRQAGRESRHDGRIRTARSLLQVPAHQRRLANLYPANRAPTEKPVHPVEDDAGHVLDLERNRSLDSQHQRGRIGIILVHAPRPDHPHRLGMIRDVGADDLGPVRHQAGLGKALLRERAGDGLAGQLAQEARLRAPGLVHGVRLWQIGGMSLAAKPRGKKTTELGPQAAPDAAQLLQWYDRHRRALPWRARAGESADPYRVWLSEIMLQQTTVKAVAPYYAR